MDYERAQRIHLLDQTAVPTRDLALIIGQFRTQLIDAGFSEEGAERICDTFAAEVFIIGSDDDVA